MKYAVGFFGGRVWMVNPHNMIRGDPLLAPAVSVAEGELFKGKGWALLDIHAVAFVDDYPGWFDRVTCKKSMAKLPWKVFGQKEDE